MAAGLVAVFLASFAILNLPVAFDLRDIVVRLIGYVFGLFFLLSLGALYHATGTDLLGPLGRVLEKKPVLGTIVFLLTLVYFIPDMLGSSLYVADLFSMAGRTAPVFAAAASAFVLSLALVSFLAGRIRTDLSRLFGLPQLVLFLALTKLVAGGVRGFAEFSLIQSVQGGIMKLIHDMVHQTFVFLMVPDHPLLTTTAWNFIGVLFGNTVGLWLSLIVIVLPLAMFIRKHFAETISVPGEISIPARRRIFIRSIRDERVLKSLPVFLFLLFIMSAWFAERGETSSRLYKPEPKAVVAENGVATIPLQATAEDLRDGAIHKFLLAVGGDEVRLLIMKKPDGTLAVCLDACEICPPDGYGQAKEHVVCLYCNTPIAFDAVGKPGGCNPIPLAALVTDKAVVLDTAEIRGQWMKVKTGETKAVLER
jgi:uncharacterized membrane protein